jgi:hypothetical protein
MIYYNIEKIKVKNFMVYFPYILTKIQINQHLNGYKPRLSLLKKFITGFSKCLIIT